MGFTYSEWEDVSVIVPAHNAEKTILRALHSIEKQTVKVREIIVIDDGSNDKTLELVNSEADLEGWVLPIKVISQKNAGPGAARNKGISQAQSEYLAFLDADDEWHPTKLARSIEEMKKNNCTILSHDLIHKYPNGRKFYIECSHEFEKERENSHAQLFLNDYINISTVVVKTAAVREAGGFDETSSNDSGYDLWQSILSHNKNTFHVFKGALVTYHILKSSLSSNSLTRIQGYERYIVRHAKSAAKKSILPFFVLVLIKTYKLNMHILNRSLKSIMLGQYLIILLRLPYSIIKTFICSLVMPPFTRPDNIKKYIK